ncbi:hypothetical protein [Undibacterium sp. Xuan67W]|uniref:hypothetical protein n=1 Tax=Undibacterium sp. Xuan67W TaxID=3413057 RepID=UPI003BF22D53
MIRPIIYLTLAIFMMGDFLRASVGASSFIAFTHFELTAACEVLMVVILLVMTYQKLRAVKAKSVHFIVFFTIWVFILGLLINFTMSLEKEIAQHWDNQILHLVNGTRADDINQVDWSSNTPASRKLCAIIGREQIRLFPDMLRYNVKCTQPDILLIVTLSISTVEGKANAYVKLQDQ